MEIDEYLDLVQEQLRAYDFEEKTTPTYDYPVFYKSEEKLVGNRFKTVVIHELNEASVNAVKESTEAISEDREALVEKLTNEEHSRHHFYAILLPPESTNAMEVAVKRAANDFDRFGFFLPILVSTTDETMEYKEPGLTPHLEHRAMAKKIDDLFRV